MDIAKSRRVEWRQVVMETKTDKGVGGVSV